MLVLSRKQGEEILIDDDIQIEVLGFKGSYVRLGIQAPKKVNIYRKEVYLKNRFKRNNDQIHGRHEDNF